MSAERTETETGIATEQTKAEVTEIPIQKAKTEEGAQQLEGKERLAPERARRAIPEGLVRRVQRDMDRLLRRYGLREERYAPLGALFSPSELFTMSPFEMMEQMNEEVARLTADLGVLEPELPAAATQWVPQVEVMDREDELVVSADVPGMKKEDIKIELVGDTLVLEGERRSEDEQRGQGFYRSERSYGQFRRTIPLAEGSSVDDASATLTNGVLEIRVKHPKRSRRFVEIGEGQKAEAQAGKDEIH